MESTITKTMWFQFTSKTKEWLIFSICLICMFLFIYTGYSKILEHHKFWKGLTRVEVIGPYALYISWLVPATEFIVAALLIMPRTIKLGLYSFTALIIIFTGYIISMLLWAKKVPCHCGGAIEKLTWTQHVWFNLAFIAIAVFALWLNKVKINLKN